MVIRYTYAYDLSGMPPKPDWNNAHKPPEVYSQFIQRHRRRFWWSLLVIFLLMVLVIPLAVVYRRKGKAPGMLTFTNPQFLAAFPVGGTYLAAAAVVLGTMVYPLPDGPALKVAYNAEGGKICILNKRGSTWINDVQCVDGAHPKEGTPLTMLDWVGGPSIYFITTDNYLSGIDYMVTHDTWKPSVLIEQKFQPHALSQLASCQWINGTSAWIYFQDPNEELREFGKDDYRDTKRKEGSTRLGKMIAGVVEMVSMAPVSESLMDYPFPIGRQALSQLRVPCLPPKSRGIPSPPRSYSRPYQAWRNITGIFDVGVAIQVSCFIHYVVAWCWLCEVSIMMASLEIRNSEVWDRIRFRLHRFYGFIFSTGLAGINIYLTSFLHSSTGAFCEISAIIKWDVFETPAIMDAASGLYTNVEFQLSTWLIPILLLITNLELSRFDNRSFLAIIHCLGDPIDSLWSLICKIEAWYLCYSISGQYDSYRKKALGGRTGTAMFISWHMTATLLSNAIVGFSERTNNLPSISRRKALLFQGYTPVTRTSSTEYFESLSSFSRTPSLRHVLQNFVLFVLRSLSAGYMIPELQMAEQVKQQYSRHLSWRWPKSIELASEVDNRKYLLSSRSAHPQYFHPYPSLSDPPIVTTEWPAVAE